MTIYGCTLYLVVNLWMVGLWPVPHSNQDTQTSIESYHGALKHWSSLETKGLWGRWIDWLLWRSMTKLTKHYMHTTQMKKCRFIKNNVVECIVKMNVEKATLILHTNVTHGIDDLNETNHAWMVWSQQHLNTTYKVFDALSSSLIDSNVNMKWKQWKSKELGHAPWLVALWG